MPSTGLAMWKLPNLNTDGMDRPQSLEAKGLDIKMSTIDLTPLYRTMVGFYRLAGMIDQASRLPGR